MLRVGVELDDSLESEGLRVVVHDVGEVDSGPVVLVDVGEVDSAAIWKGLVVFRGELVARVAES